MDNPPVKEEVAEAVMFSIPFERMMPSVIVSPPVEERPAVEMPPVKVEVPVPVTVSVDVEVNGPVFKDPVMMPLPSIERRRAGVVVPLPMLA